MDSKIIYTANVLGDILAAYTPARKGSLTGQEMPVGATPIRRNTDVVILYGDVDGVTCLVRATSVMDAERIVAETFGVDALIDDLDVCADQTHDREIFESEACPDCDAETLRLVSDVDGSVEHVCAQHGSTHRDLDQNSPELVAALKAAGLPVSMWDTGGGITVLSVPFTDDPRGPQIWLSRDDDQWLVGFYDFTADDGDEGVCLNLMLFEAPTERVAGYRAVDDPAAVAEAVAGIVRRTGATPPKPVVCPAVTERADVTRRLAGAFNIPTAPLDLGSEKALAVVGSMVHGIVAEYMDGGDQMAEACTCGEHVDEPRLTRAARAYLRTYEGPWGLKASPEDALLSVLAELYPAEWETTGGGIAKMRADQRWGDLAEWLDEIASEGLDEYEIAVRLLPRVDELMAGAAV